MNNVLLTHYQTTNFRLFQTKRVCRRQFQIWRNWKKVIQTGRKHCSRSVFKMLVSQGRQTVSLCGNWLINYFYKNGLLQAKEKNPSKGTGVGRRRVDRTKPPYLHENLADLDKTSLNK